MPRRSILLRLAVQDLKHRPGRALVLAFAVAVGGGAIFAATVLGRSIEASFGTALDRLGADLMVVPRGVTVNLTAALLTVEPTDQTLDGDTVRAIAALPGVDLAAPQRYFALPSSDPSHGGQEDLVAFDPARDFTVLPWLVETVGGTPRRGDVIVGGRRPEAVGSTVRMFDREFRVFGRLALTGVGPFERAIFTTYETAADVDAAARASGRGLVADPNGDRASAVLVRVGGGGTPEQVRFAAAGLPGVQVVSGNGLSTSVRQALRLILGGAVAFSALILLATALMVGALYNGLLNERRRELGLLLSLGMRPAQLIRLILAEAALTTGLGGLCGVVVGAAGLVAFQRSIGYAFEQQGIPFTMPSPVHLATAAVASAMICGAVGVVGAMLPAWRAGRSEPYSLVRGEGG
jgi:putative ABC transport system permease protein